MFKGFCLLKGIAEGTYKSKHAEAARLYSTTTRFNVGADYSSADPSQLLTGRYQSEGTRVLFTTRGFCSLWF